MRTKETTRKVVDLAVTKHHGLALFSGHTELYGGCPLKAVRFRGR